MFYTTREEDEGGVEGQLDLCELELSQVLGKVEDGRDEFRFDRIRREESLDGQ